MQNLFIKGVIILAGLFALDSTIGRWLLRFTTTFRPAVLPGYKTESRRLMVYLPGILFDGEESVAEIKHSLLKHVSKGLFISYGFWRFIPGNVLKRTASMIGRATTNGFTSKYDSIVIVGASFGGRVAADLCLELRTQYGWEASTLKVVMVDTPCENNSFQMPGLTVSLIMRRLFIGPLVSLLIAPLSKLALVGPFDVDIEPGHDNDQLRKKLINRMAKFMMSSVADQQRYLADNSIEWTMGLRGVEVVYLWCDFNNITVVQPAAMRKVELFTEGKVSQFSWRAVPSPHCGFAQMPRTWSEVFDEVLAA